MDDGAPALEQTGGEASDVANRATAECDDRGRAGRATFGKAGKQVVEDLPLLGGLALWKQDRRVAIEQGAGALAVKCEDARLADQDWRPESGQPVTSVGNRADQNVIGRRARD